MVPSVIIPKKIRTYLEELNRNASRIWDIGKKIFLIQINLS